MAMSNGAKAKKKKQTADKNEDSGIPEKKPKVDFTEIYFKHQLKDPNTTFLALEKFSDTAKQWSPAEGYDIVTGYCQSSPECGEVFKVLEVEKRKPAEIYAVFAVLESIMLRILDEGDKFMAVGQNIVQRMLSAHMHQVYFTLQMNNKSSHIKMTLKLLTAMVMLGEQSARAILTQFDFNHTVISPLFQRKDKKDSQDVRTCIIHFAISFLITGSVTKQLMEHTGFVRCIFPGLKSDNSQTIQLVLNTILEKIIRNLVISKTQKVHLFDEWSLEHIAQLYHWTGALGWREKADTNIVKIEDRDENQVIVIKTVHTFLLELCCSQKNGINFFDKSFGISKKNQNHILTGLLTSLKRITEVPETQELVVKTLRVCPDQIQYFLPTLLHSLSPRPSAKWLSAVLVLYKIYEGQPDRPAVLKLKESVPVKKFSDMVLIGVIPPSQVLYTVLQALKHKHMSVRHTAMDLVGLILRRVVTTIKYLEQDKGVCALYSAVDITNIIDNIKEATVKAVPDIQMVFTCWDKLTTISDVKDVLMETEDGSNIAIDVVSDSDHMIKLQEVIALYQELLPLILVENPSNVNKLLEGVRKLSEQQTTHKSELSDDDVTIRQLNMLNILSGMDARKLPWNKESGDGHSLMYLLLEMLSRTQTLNDSHLASSASQLVSQLLYNTGLFQYQIDELYVWIRHFNAVTKEMSSSEEKSSVINYLAKIFTSVIVNPYSHTDKVSEFVSEGIAMETVGCNVETMSTSTNDIDGVLDLDDEDLEEGGVVDMETSHEADAFRFPFSPLLIVALENLSKLDIKQKCLTDLVSMVAIDVFHLQLQPLPMACLLKSCHGDVVEKHILHYIFSWITDQNTKTKKMKPPVGIQKFASSEELIRMYTKTTLAENSDFVQQLLDSVGSTAAENRLLITKQTLLYISSIVDLYIKKGDKVDVMLNVLFQVLSTVIQTCIKEPRADDTDDTDSVDVDGTQLMTLCQRSQSQRSRSYYLHDVLQAVLSHPVLMKWFLYSDADPSMTLPNDKAKHLTKHITLHMSDIFCCLTDVNLEPFKISLTSYFEKIRLHLELETKGSGIQDQMDTLVQVTQSCLSVFSKYLGPGSQSELLHTLISLPSTYLISQDTQSLTPVGNLLSSLIDRILESCHGNQLKLTCKDVKTLFCHIVECPDLFDICSKVLQRHPNFSVVVHNTVFRFLLSRAEASAKEMLCIIIQHNSMARKQFKTWILENNLKENRSNSAVLVNKYLECLLHSNEPVDRSSLQRLYEIYKEDLLNLHTDSAGVTCHMFTCLHKLGAIDSEVQKTVCGRLTNAVKRKSDVTVAHIQILQQLTSSTGSTPVLSRDQMYFVCRQCLMNVAKDNGKLQQCLLKILCQFTQDELESLSEEKLVKDFMSFTKSCLKFLFTERRMFDVLSVLVRSLCRDGSPEVDLTLVCNMTMSHSLFLPIMLHEKYPDTRECLVDFILTLVEVCPSLCSSQHIGIFLGSYGATLSQADQKLLKLLHLYEKNNINMTEYRPYLWGAKAVEHHSVKKTLGSSLWNQPTTGHVMECIDTEKMKKSILKFPLLRKLQPDTVKTASEWKSEEHLYDPCFILALFSNLLSADSLVDCRMFVERDCLGYTMAALSSHCSETRGAAYHVLSCYLHHLEGARFHEQRQILYLVELLQNSVEKPNIKLSCIITVFLSRVVQQLLKPDEHMYKLINSFLLLKPALDVGNVPEFYKLFNSSALEFKVERSWILGLFVDGLRETADYRIFEKLYVFKLLLSYHDSTISDKNTQLQVLKLIRNASVERTVTVDLIKHHGILSWLSGVISMIREDDDVKVTMVTDILFSLWFSMAEDRYRNPGQTQKIVSLAVTREICICLKQILRHYGKDTIPTVYVKFLQTLQSVLKNLYLAVKAAEQNGHDIKGDGLTTQDVCLLLINSARFGNNSHTILACTEALQRLKLNITSGVMKNKITFNNKMMDSNTTVSADSESGDKKGENSENVVGDEAIRECKSIVERIYCLSVSICTSWNAWSHDQSDISLLGNQSLAVTCSVVWTSALFCLNLVPRLPHSTVLLVMTWLQKHICPAVGHWKLLAKQSGDQVEKLINGLVMSYEKLFCVDKETDKECSSENTSEDEVSFKEELKDNSDVRDSVDMLNKTLKSVIETHRTVSNNQDLKTFTGSLNLKDLKPEDYSCVLRQYCLGAENPVQFKCNIAGITKPQVKSRKKKKY